MSTHGIMKTSDELTPGFVKHDEQDRQPQAHPPYHMACLHWQKSPACLRTTAVDTPQTVLPATVPACAAPQALVLGRSTRTGGSLPFKTAWMHIHSPRVQVPCTSRSATKPAAPSHTAAAHAPSAAAGPYAEESTSPPSPLSPQLSAPPRLAATRPLHPALPA